MNVVSDDGCKRMEKRSRSQEDEMRAAELLCFFPSLIRSRVHAAAVKRGSLPLPFFSLASSLARSESSLAPRDTRVMSSRTDAEEDVNNHNTTTNYAL